LRLINNFVVRVFCKSGEDEQLIKEGLLRVAGFSFEDLEREKLVISRCVAKGFDDKIIIFELFLQKPRHLGVALNNLVNNLSVKDKGFLCAQDNRLDDNLDFYLRLLKPGILEDFFELTDSGDCFHVKFNVASFPKNKVVAKQNINKLFS